MVLFYIIKYKITIFMPNCQISLHYILSNSLFSQRMRRSIQSFR